MRGLLGTDQPLLEKRIWNGKERGFPPPVPPTVRGKEEESTTKAVYSIVRLCTLSASCSHFDAHTLTTAKPSGRSFMTSWPRVPRMLTRPTRPAAGSFDVRLTDAPGDVVQANVTIERVAVVPVTDSGEGDATEGGGEILSDSAFTADLTKLQAGGDTALARIDRLRGTFGQIRLVTADAADVLYETADGDTAQADLKQPSASETGIKINFQPVTLNDPTDEAVVTLDFSVEDSFVKAGSSGMYIFKPVVHAQSVVANGDTIATDTTGSGDA